MSYASFRVGYGAYYKRDTNHMYPHVMDFEFETVDDFRHGFLKCFGNIWGSNKAEKDRKLVKEMTYRLNSTEKEDIYNWAWMIEKRTNWRLTVKVKGEVII